ncbi:PilZ domain-containing protein [Cohnella abietis]|uniref:PilZ domain-containing protein n=1 Tax=Cohnella abietis TaxID=2507935 RepID=A0A3T1D167_9BACL|nr:PilZ domain-containing protein [Cohnella abietis]BBI31759.1 hypothetical protein KCTCHS21_11580 [Cohnella abietis]
MEDEIQEHRREHIRFELTTPLYAELSLLRVQEREIGSRSQRVMLNNISLGGCQFKTHLQIPLRDDVEWLLKLKLGHYLIQLKAVVVNVAEDEGLYLYGVKWILTGLEKQSFQYRLNEYLRIMLISSPHIYKLYQKIADRSNDGQFKQLDVSS